MYGFAAVAAAAAAAAAHPIPQSYLRTSQPDLRRLAFCQAHEHAIQGEALSSIKSIRKQSRTSGSSGSIIRTIEILPHGFSLQAVDHSRVLQSRHWAKEMPFLSISHMWKGYHILFWFLFWRLLEWWNPRFESLRGPCLPIEAPLPKQDLRHIAKRKWCGPGLHRDGNDWNW